jgi:hypothetical protein
MNDSKKLADEITNYLNTFGDKSEEFNNAMSTEHRTLQQNFTRLVLGWIEHVGSDSYRHDGRNEASHKTCKQLLDGFREIQARNGYDGDALDFMSKPAGYLPSV